jgi:tetratricopeptide (TPR) repeat protein
LVDARTGNQIWGEQYNRKTSDLVSLQSEIARDVSNQLRMKLSGADEQKLAKNYSANPEAYQLYLKGNYFAAKYTKDGLQKGIEYFNQAIAIDPNYAQAYNGLAYYYISTNDWYLSPRDAMPKAREAAKKALAIDETLSAAHTSLAIVAYWYDWDWATAEREFKRAIELNANDPRPHEFYGWSLANTGRVDEAIAEGKRAQQLDPISPETSALVGQVLIFVHQYDQAIAQLRNTLELDSSYWLAHDFLGRAYEQKGRLPEAIAEFQRALELESAVPENRSMLGHAYALSGKKAEAQKMIDELKDLSKRSYVPPYNIAVVYAGLGDKDQAFAWLDRAYNDRSFYLTWIKVDPDLDSLRSDSRFADLVRRVGLP